MAVRDVTAPKKKHALLKWVKAWNVKHKTDTIKIPKGFDPDTEVVGDPARSLLKEMQRRARLHVTGQFTREVMLVLLPVGINSKVMALAHSQLGVHEWPSGTNRGEVIKYLQATGINFGAPWCAAFVTWVLKKSGFKAFPSYPASADSWGRWGKARGILKPVNKSIPGDLWGWEWNNGDGMWDHIGFCDDRKPGDNVAYYLDGNVGAYGGSVTKSSRSAKNIGYVIDLQKLYKLR